MKIYQSDSFLGSCDFFAFNHYTSAYASDNKTKAPTMYRYRHSDVFVEFGKDWPPTGAHWSKVSFKRKSNRLNFLKKAPHSS